MKPPIRHPRLNPARDPELQQFAAHIGKFIEYWGFKSVQGKIWCYLYLSKTPLSSIEISKLLKISPALVTQSVKILLDYEVIHRADKGANGVLRFTANPNISEPILKVLMGREQKILEQINHLGAELTKVSTQESTSGYALDQQKLAQLQQWIGFASMIFESAIVLLSQEGNPLSNSSADL